MRADIGSYQLERVLGEGGMGIVYLAEHRVLKRRVAIKVLAPSATTAMPAALQRFLDEAQATSAIEDPGIVQIFDFGYDADGRAYLVMEYLEGERLDQRVSRMGPLPVAQALRITRQLASSLRAAHARAVLHRDLKPENILLVNDPAVPGGERSKLLDFGICKMMHRDLSVTCTGTIVGTPTYMSPEQCRGNRDLDARSDMYSLGCVLYFLLTGQPPFPYRSTGELLAAHLKEKAPPASKINSAVPAEVDELLRRCLAKLPADRVQSMPALIGEIDDMLAHITGELPAAVTTSSFLRAEPANTTLTFALAAEVVRLGTAPTRSSGGRMSWGRRALLLAAAALALSAPASPQTAYPSDVIPPAARTPRLPRTVAVEMELPSLPVAVMPAVSMQLRSSSHHDEAEPAADESGEVAAPAAVTAPAAIIDPFQQPSS